MATHRIPIPHFGERHATERAEAGEALARPEPNFWLIMTAPLIIAFTVLATALISQRSFGG
jgi:hypothetical protein